MVRVHHEVAAGTAAATLILGLIAEPALGQPVAGRPADTGGPPPELTLRSVCPRVADKWCTLTTLERDGSPGEKIDVDNQSGLRAIDIGGDILEVQLGGKTYRVSRMSVVVQRVSPPVGRAIDCDRVAGVRASGCDGR